MPDEVFISYKREDHKHAMKLRNALRAENISVWWDDELLASSRWEQAIDDALTNAVSIVVLWSKNSVKSNWVQYEAAVAKGRDVLVPVEVEDCEIPEIFQSVNAVNLREWEGHEDDRNFQKLVGVVGSHINRRLEDITNLKKTSVKTAVIGAIAGIIGGVLLYMAVGKSDVQILGGQVSLHNSDYPRILDGSTCEDGDFRGAKNVRIKFARPFNSEPQVIMALSQYDMANSGGVRLSVYPESIDANGFSYDFVTYCDSVIHSATASWIAIEK